MQNYRLLFTENNTNDRYLILLNIIKHFSIKMSRF